MLRKARWQFSQSKPGWVWPEIFLLSSSMIHFRAFFPSQSTEVAAEKAGHVLYFWSVDTIWLAFWCGLRCRTEVPGCLCILWCPSVYGPWHFFEPGTICSALKCPTFAFSRSVSSTNCQLIPSSTGLFHSQPSKVKFQDHPHSLHLRSGLGHLHWRRPRPRKPRYFATPD